MEYRVVCLVDAKDEEQLSDEKGGGSVVDDAAQVGGDVSQTGEEDNGEEDEAQSH